MQNSLAALKAEVEQLKEGLRKISQRDSHNSSPPSSAEAHKKKSKAIKQRTKKQGPKYGHAGSTRNGFASVDHQETLHPQQCPVCGVRSSE